MLDFGKIIIYTSNLRIIRAPVRKPETLRHHTLPPVDLEGYPKAKERGSRRMAKALTQDGEEKKEEKRISDTESKVMIPGQIFLSGAVEFYHPVFCFLPHSLSARPPPSLFLCICLQPPFLFFIFPSEGITAGWPVQPYYCNL